jgi:hypothetical protein
MRTGDPAANARTQSGMSRSVDQSPPPITLPARAEAIANGRGVDSFRNERRQAATAISAQALLAL